MERDTGWLSKSDDTGPVLQAKFTFQIERLKH
jgi:hypothetical protein